MARRPPARIRAEAPLRHPWTPRIDGLSPHALTIIARLERTRFDIGATADALLTWERAAGADIGTSLDTGDGCEFLGCCPDLDDVHWVLQVVAHALPPADARAFRRRIASPRVDRTGDPPGRWCGRGRAQPQGHGA